MQEKDLSTLGFPGYKVDSDGNISSWKCKGGTRIRRWKKLKPWKTRGGYRIIGLNVNGKRNYKLVHHIVLEAFIGPRPSGMECCHENNNPSDNRLENLRWDTPKNNCLDRKLNGLHSANTSRGSKHGMSKLTEQEVIVIRRLAELKIFTQAKLPYYLK